MAFFVLSIGAVSNRTFSAETSFFWANELKLIVKISTAISKRMSGLQ